MYNGTLSRVCITSVALEKQWLLNMMSVCLHSCLSYLACKLHLFCTALYLHLWPAGSTMFFCIISKKLHSIWKKIIIAIKCAL